MAGQLGNEKVSVLNQKLARVVPDKGLVLICGGIPGAANSVVEIRGAVKKNGGKAAES
jgi:large subunit ribosomal protein L3